MIYPLKALDLAPRVYRSGTVHRVRTGRIVADQLRARIIIFGKQLVLGKVTIFGLPGGRVIKSTIGAINRATGHNPHK